MLSLARAGPSLGFWANGHELPLALYPSNAGSITQATMPWAVLITRSSGPHYPQASLALLGHGPKNNAGSLQHQFAPRSRLSFLL